MSVVEVRRKRRGQVWEPQPGARRNRRITLDTVFTFDGPARGSDLLKTVEDPRGVRVRGTMNNCAGGTTPWGTVLSGEENFNQYFYATGTDPKEARYGLGAQDSRGWRAIDPRWDATRPEYANEPNRFGWIVEIDPLKPNATPVKHTAMGRFKHEGANVVVARNGHLVAYMGDDERFDYVYRFVSAGTVRKGSSDRAREHNKTLLSAGDLSVARFTGDGLDDGVSDGGGEWIPLTRDGRSMVPGFSLEEVLVYTRLAADAVQPTKMDRPEDVEVNLVNGRVYVACTNNTDRGKAGKEGPTEPNPRAANKDGHVVELVPAGGDHTARDVRLEPGAGVRRARHRRHLLRRLHRPGVADLVPRQRRVRLGGQPVGLHRRPAVGDRAVGRAVQGAPSPVRSGAGCSSSSPSPRAPRPAGRSSATREGSVLVAVQHPGENGSWDVPQSRFPDFVPAGATAAPGDFAGPRPSVVQVVRG